MIRPWLFIFSDLLVLNNIMIRTQEICGPVHRHNLQGMNSEKKILANKHFSR